MLRRFTRTAPLASRSPSAHGREPVTDASRDLVVLVHGMGRSPISMTPMAHRLGKQGFDTLNFGYNSFTSDVGRIAEDLSTVVERETERRAASRVHFVTHSLGGIAVRYLLQTDRPEHLGRVVMLAPPNQGSASADRWTPWVGWLLRPISELRSESSTVAAMAPPEAVEFAIIAGDADGKVSLEESQLEGAAEHVVVESRHSFIMAKPSVARMTACFLRTGRMDCTEAQ